jgi:hypothetical protein
MRGWLWQNMSVCLVVHPEAHRSALHRHLARLDHGEGIQDRRDALFQVEKNSDFASVSIAIRQDV